MANGRSPSTRLLDLGSIPNRSCRLQPRRFSLARQAFLVGWLWIFKAWRVYPSDVCRGRAGFPRPALVHRQDEPARLSLGVVASQQSQLLFHLEADCNSGAKFNCGKSLLPSYGVRVLKMP